MNKTIEWTEEEIELLREKYSTSTKQELLKLFPHRSWKSISGKAERMKLKKIGKLKRNYWSDEEIKILRENYSNKPKEELLKLIPDKNWRQIQDKASEIGVRKYKEYSEPRQEWNEEKISKLVSDRGYIYHGTYFDEFNKRKIIVECPNGIVDHVYFNNFKKGANAGSLCPTRKKEFEEVLEFFKKENYILLTKKDEYVNSKTRLKAICPNGHEYETNATNFYHGNRCRKCHFQKLAEIHLLDFDYIKQEFEKEGFIVVDKNYKGVNEKLNCLCKKHIKKSIIHISYIQLKNNKNLCPHCIKEQKVKRLINKYDYIHKKFIDKNFKLITSKKEYIERKIEDKELVFRFICNKHYFYGEQKIKEKSFSDKSTCKYCTKDLIKGENHSNWNGGISSLTEFLRSKINNWKIDSFKKYNYKCYLTNSERNLVIHHVYPFSEIVKESLEELNLDIKKSIGEYSEEELNSIIEKVNKNHYKYGLGVCLRSDIHKLFHMEYSFFNFTPKDFEEFVVRFKNGEFDDFLEEVAV